MIYKKCPACGLERHVECFYRVSRKGCGYATYCKACNKHRVIKWQKENRVKLRPKTRREKLIRRYGISPEDFDNLLKCQSYRCAICGCSELDRKGVNWYIDHNHITGKVRGVLCIRCNTLLGQAEDKIERLETAIFYLRKHA